MKVPFADHITFFQQFRQRFETTGAIAPSSRFLAGALTRHFERRTTPAKLLEIGPGTGAVTQRIVKLLKPEDRFDLVELNETFASLLQDRFDGHPRYQRVAGQSQVHICALQDFKPNTQYDYIVSGLPLNNFSAELVKEIFGIYFQLLAPGGVLSYFEYMYVRPIRKAISKQDEKLRLQSLDDIMSSYISRHRIRQSWVFVNFPPAWVQHLQNEDPQTAHETNGQHRH